MCLLKKRRKRKHTLVKASETARVDLPTHTLSLSFQHEQVRTLLSRRSCNIACAQLVTQNFYFILFYTFFLTVFSIILPSIYTNIQLVVDEIVVVFILFIFLPSNTLSHFSFHSFTFTCRSVSQF